MRRRIWNCDAVKGVYTNRAFDRDHDHGGHDGDRVAADGHSVPWAGGANAADQFVAANSFTKATAIRWGRLAELHIDATNNRYWVEIDTSGTGNRMKAGGYRYVSDNVGMTSNRSLVCFDQRGLPTTRTTTAGLACQAANLPAIFLLGNRVDTVQTTALGKVLR